MYGNVLPHRLHNRATRGGTLTETEQVTLQLWYEWQDAEAAAQIVASAPAAPTLENLRAEVSAAFQRLHTVMQQTQTQSEGNALLRQEIAALAERLAQTTPPKVT